MTEKQKIIQRFLRAASLKERLELARKFVDHGKQNIT